MSLLVWCNNNSESGAFRIPVTTELLLETVTGTRESGHHSTHRDLRYGRNLFV